MTEAQQLANALHEWTDKQKSDADLVRSLCRSIEQEVIALIPRMPDTWDGHELRLMLAERFDREVFSLMRDKRSRRRRQYDEAKYNL